MIYLKKYKPHIGQRVFHYAIDKLYRYVGMVCGIRGGKTHSGAREAGRQAWNSLYKPPAAYCIVAPTYNMLDKTTWVEFAMAMSPLILKNNTSKKVIVLRNGNLVYGFSAEEADRIRNITATGFWIDEARECKKFAELWKIMLGRVLSTQGKGIVTTSPNSFDDIYDIFVANRKPQYGFVHFPTRLNDSLPKGAVDELGDLYDEKFMRQELLGEFVIFEGAVYYTFNRGKNAGDLAFELCKYNPSLPIRVCIDFNVDPALWILAHFVTNDKGLREIRVFDEIFLRNSYTDLVCDEFIRRYPNHAAGLYLYGDATGRARHSSSNVTNWKIVEERLQRYGLHRRVPLANPAEFDRINATNAILCNSKGERRTLVNPKCKHLIRDFEQVPFKEGTRQIDKKKDLMLTHASDGFGYMAEKEFSLNKGRIEGLKI